MLAVVATGTISNGGSFSLSNSWKAGDAAGPTKVIITGSKGSIQCGWGGYNNGNEIVTTIEGDGSSHKESVDGPFPNTRTTMYYQLTAFVEEVRAHEAGGNAGKPWAYTMKSCPTDAVKNMAALDAVYARAGIGPRPSTNPPPPSGLSARM